MAGSMTRLVLAAIAAPFIGCVLGTVLYSSAYVAVFTRQFDALAAAPVYGLVYAIGVGLPAMLVIGLPLHFGLRRLNLTTLPAYVATGLIGGAVTVGAIFFLAGLNFGTSYATPLNDAFAVLPVGLLIGICVSSAFWFIRRPDRGPSH